jgi:hypothetical protein
MTVPINGGLCSLTCVGVRPGRRRTPDGPRQGAVLSSVAWASPLAPDGPDERRRIVLLRVPGIDTAREFCNSPEYQETRKLRPGAATGGTIAVEGIEIPGTDT